MKRTIRMGLFFLGWVQVCVAGQQPFTLVETLQFALDHSPPFSSAKNAQVIRELEYRSAVARVLPAVDFTATHGLQNNIPIASTSSASPIFASNTTTPWFSSLNLGVTENLYDNGVSFATIAIANLNREMADLNFLKARDSLVLSVALSYYRYSLATVLFEVKKHQQAILEKQFSTLNSQYQQGFKTKSDFLRLKTQVQRAEIDRIQAENQINLAVADLRKQLGVNPKDLDPPSFQIIEVAKNQSIEELPLNRPPSLEKVYDYQIAKVQLEANEKNVQLAERRYWPQLFTTLGMSYVNQNYLNSTVPFSDGNRLTWNALLTLQFNIWDWGTRRRDVAIAQLNRDIQENTVNQNLLDVNAKLASIVAENSRLSRHYKLSQELMILEEDSYKNLEYQYRDGKVSYLDLMTGLSTFLDAQVQFYTSYFDAMKNLAEYKFYEGSIYGTLFKK